MKLGKTLGDYIRFEKGLLLLTVIVGLIRLGLTLSGIPDATVTWFSLTGVTLLGVVYLPINVHLQGFGSYRHLFVLLALQLALSGVMSATGIGIAAATGVPNIFQSDNPNANPAAHAAQHLLGGPIIGGVIFWLPAAVIMFVTKMVVKRR